MDPSQIPIEELNAVNYAFAFIAPKQRESPVPPGHRVSQSAPFSRIIS